MTEVHFALLAALALSFAAGTVYGARRGLATAWRKYAPEIRESEAQLRAALDSLDQARCSADAAGKTVRATLEAAEEGILVLDAAARIVERNEQIDSWFGLDPTQTPTLISGLGSAELRDHVLDTLSDELPPGEPTEVRIDDRLFRVGVVPIGDGTAVVALRDATEMHRLARARRDLLANVSHDLRTPLASLALLVEMMLGDADGTRKSELVGRIREQVDTLRALADALVEISALESGRALLRLEPIPLRDLVTTAVEGMRPQIERAEVTVDVLIDGSALVLADRPHMVRVFTNLLDNALRYSPPGGTVLIEASPSDEADRLETRIRDQGPGISVADAQRIFERFYRADPARSGPGKGLGLAIARHVVEGHGGRIWIDSQVRPGACVCFTLPRPD